MSERGFLVVALLLVTTSCGPKVNEPMSSASEGTGSGSSSGSGPDVTSTGAAESSSSSSSTGGGAMCEDWTPPEESGWSLQNCRTRPCPEGEVCRFAPAAGCDGDPVCVDPTTHVCNCELYGEDVHLACPCPGYEGPMKGGKAILECSTATSQWPTYLEGCPLE
jgi:hypothetical protein